jgi:ABC-type nitrate/sulfonate/bicarbonate transport system permease component
MGFVLMLAVWQAVATAYNLQVILPPPWAVVQHAYDVLTLRSPWPYGPNIYAQAGMSLVRAMIGFGLGIAVGMPLGLVIGRVRVVREILGPVLKVFYPIPSIAWVPIMILWFGLTPTAIIAMVALGVFFPMLFNAEAGARTVAEVQINAARCYGANGLRLFTKVVLPSAVPFLASGLRIGIGDAWRLVIAGEIVVGQSGIGFVLNQSRFLFQTADLLTAMAVVAVVGYASEILVVRMLEKRTIEIWQPAPQ